MNKILDRQAIEHIAKLAKLEINATQAEEYGAQLSGVLAHFEEISKIDTKNIEPMVTPAEVELFFRSDESRKEIEAEDLMANAPDRIGNLFRVPPVV